MNRCIPIFCAAAAWLAGPVLALDSDRDQPAQIAAESTDIDFNSGKRTYVGDVRMRQGSIKLDADKLEVYTKNNKLEKAIAVGEPAVFSQRPEGKTTDVIGRGKIIHVDQVTGIVTLTQGASVTQGPDSITGKTIIYNMNTDKMSVRSGGETPTVTTKIPEGAASTAPPPIEPIPQAGTATEAAAQSAPSPAEEAADGKPRRPRIILKPKDAE